MPITDVYLSVIGSFIIILLAIIGYLIKYGVDRVCNEIKSIWEWIRGADESNAHFREELASLKSDIKAHRQRCYEIHLPGGRRVYDPDLRPVVPQDEV